MIYNGVRKLKLVYVFIFYLTFKSNMYVCMYLIKVSIQASLIAEGDPFVFNLTFYLTDIFEMKMKIKNYLKNIKSLRHSISTNLNFIVISIGIECGNLADRNYNIRWRYMALETTAYVCLSYVFAQKMLE